MAVVKVEPALIREQIERLTQSATFRSSAIQRRLLNYLAEKSISDDHDPLKEYTIGVEAFGKAEIYDPRRDSTVRIQAGKLRQKLREYYQSEGRSDPVAIDLPKGAFRLTFELRDATAEAHPAPPVKDEKLRWICAALGIACLVAVLAAVDSRIKLERLQDATAGIIDVWTPELEAIWQPFLAKERPLVVCIGTPLFLRMSPQSLPQMLLRSSAFPDWEAAQTSELVTSLQQRLKSAQVSPRYNFTGIGEASGAFKLASLLSTRRHNVALERSNTISWEEIARSDVIFLGPPKFNLQLADMPVEQDLVMDPNSIRNLRPKPGEPAVLATGSWPTGSKIVEDYALISRLPAPGRDGTILVLASVVTAGTEAAVQYLSDANYAREFVKAIQLPTGKLPRYFQVVIKAKFKSGIPLQISYLFHHVLKAP